MGCWRSQYAFADKLCPVIANFVIPVKTGPTLASAVSMDGRRSSTTRTSELTLYDESGLGDVCSFDFRAGM